MTKTSQKKALSEIEIAYDVLSDSEKRKKYDRAHGTISSITPVFSRDLNFEAGEEVSEIGLKTDQREFSFYGGNKGTSQNVEPFAKIDSEINAAKSAVEEDKKANTFLDEDQLSNAEIKMAKVSEKIPSFEKTNQEVRAVGPAPANPLSLYGHSVRNHYEKSPEMEEKLEEASFVDGVFLREAREYKNVTVNEIMEYTKLSRKYVTAIETDDQKKLPAPVYVRGFVIQYVKALRLDSNKIATAYMRNFQNVRESRGRK